MNLKIVIRNREEKLGKIMNRASGTCATISQVLQIGNCIVRGVIALRHSQPAFFFSTSLYIKNPKFTPMPSIPIQHHIIHSSFDVFHICTSFSNSSHYLQYISQSLCKQLISQPCWAAGSLAGGSRYLLGMPPLFKTSTFIGPDTWLFVERLKEESQ